MPGTGSVCDTFVTLTVVSIRDSKSSKQAAFCVEIIKPSLIFQTQHCSYSRKSKLNHRCKTLCFVLSGSMSALKQLLMYRIESILLSKNFRVSMLLFRHVGQDGSFHHRCIVTLRSVTIRVSISMLRMILAADTLHH